MKKIFAIFTAVVLLLSVTVTFASAAGLGLGKMFVYTENGKTLNVRSSPETGDNIIGQLPYGASVNVTAFEGSWARIDYSGGSAWVQSRFLQWYAPGPKPTPKPDPEPDPDTKQMNAELRSEVSIAPTALLAQASRSTGWVNMRLYPSKATRRIQTCSDGTPLTAFAETTNWYHVTDPATGNSGYIRKDFLKLAPVPQPAVDETTRIGTLNVNGEFMIQGKIPEGYQLRVISSQKSKIIAVLEAEDMQRPQMMLTISFDEMYANVDRMNDLTAEEMETLKQSFTDLNEVAFSEAQTTAGTKLLVARETGNDEDFVSILSVYKGYSVEFVLSPNPSAANQTLTDEQVQKGIDFLSNLDFIPAN